MVENKIGEKNVPELRFPEFSGEWQTKKLGEIGSTYTGLKGKSAKDFENGNASFIRYMQIFQNSKIDKNYGMVYISKNENQNRVEKGDIFFTSSSETPEEVGYTSVLLNKCDNLYLNSFCFGYRADKNILSSEFAAFFFHSSEIRKTITKLAQGSTRYNISKNNLMKLCLRMPQLEEQQKIASFLTAVDDKIAALTQKCENLERYKRGVMQQIFSQEIRFTQPNNTPYPDWQTKKLGEIADIITGKTPSTTNKNLWTGDIPFVTPTDIVDNKKYQDETSRHVSMTKNIKIVPRGSILFTCIASIGKMCLLKKDSVTNQQINSIIPHKEYDNDFIYYAVLYISPRIKNSQANATVPIINKNDFSKYLLRIPDNIEEQQQIASFLSAIDSRIDLTRQKLTATQQFKKALLQRMFV